MEQIVGQNCARCGKRIGSVLEGEFCFYCGQPVHLSCRTAASAFSCRPEARVCGSCGTAIQDPDAVKERLKKLDQLDSERAYQFELRDVYGPDLGRSRSEGKREMIGGICLMLIGLFGLCGGVLFWGAFAVGAVMTVHGYSKMTTPSA